MEQFIERYGKCNIALIKSFASGLRGDIDAVRNSVTSNLSNGFVEGCNNKIKAIKRMMYGRAKIDLLRVKVLFAR
jgi:transposase